MVNYDEAYASSLEYFHGNELAARVFVGKYALQDLKGDYLESNPDQMIDRVANELHRIEQNYPNPIGLKKIKAYLEDFAQIIPQGSPLFGIGNKLQTVSLGNCFVIESPHDSYGGIMKTDQELAQLMKRRGGVGVDISTLRPEGEIVHNSAKTTSGIGGFMERFSNTCREVGQKGRRGAEIITLNVHHPEIETFINIKKDLTKVTGANISVKFTDEFMNAVRNNETYEQRFPVELKEGEIPKISRQVDAKKIYDMFCQAAWQSAEPGVLYWDTANKYSPAHNYGKIDAKFYNAACNPCLTGDTIVATADGRKGVTFKELAETGLDVPVYALNDEGKTVIKTMRNPRITGYDKPVWKITLDDGNSFKATENHKMCLSDGKTYVEIKDLQIGDSLAMLSRINASIQDINKGSNAKSQDYVWIKNSLKEGYELEHRLIYSSYNGIIPEKHIIHHKDYTGINNNIENLQCMTREAHQALHAEQMRGQNNPIHKLKRAGKFEEYKSRNSFYNTTGAENPNFSGVSNEDLKQHIVDLTLKLGRKITNPEWVDYAKSNQLPQHLSKFRKDAISSNPLEDIAKSLGFFITSNRKLFEIYKKAFDQGYKIAVIEESVFIERICEECGEKYMIPYSMREISFCSAHCSMEYSRKKEINKQKHISLLPENRKINTLKQQQMSAYTELKFQFNRNPSQIEWAQHCSKIGISNNLRHKYGFYSFKALEESSQYFNHRIVSIEHVGYENVYNGTVDDVHNFYFGCFDRINKETGKIESLSFNSLQCGEIIMSAFDSCRLMLMNLNYYVKDKFLSTAYFDFVAFKKASYDAQKLMDDTIDLEIEKMHAILKKINLDPEPDNVKYAEKTMWESFLDTTIKGRRTGLGITGLGDALAALNIQYGSADSVKMSEDIYRTLCLGSYESSIDMAEQRGAFPLFNLEIDKDNGFMENLLPQLSPEYLAKYEKYGRRNIAALTTAPAGSVSLMALFAEDINGKYFGVTSGIEPVFKTEHIRRKKINPNDKDAQVDFVDDLGDKWQEFPVYHTAYKYWKDMHLCGATNMPNPYINASSEDIDWNTSVLLQSKAQKWIDHSISKTCNLPNSATVELVSQVYMTAWESGCKGFTVYRDGSRSGVLISATPTNENKEIFNETTAPKRPASLKCEVHYSNIDKSKWIILVGMLNGKPYEVFGGIIDEEKTVISKSIKEAELVKNAKGNYDLVKDEAVLVSNVLETLNNSSYNFHTRTLSMALRHGAPVQYIVEQLQKIGDKEIGLYSFNKVIARVLKKYIPDGTIRKGASCPSCGSLNVAYQEGCLSCKDCGYSKCG